jgi:hypothetical protein
MKSSKIKFLMLIGAAFLIGGAAFFWNQPESTGAEIVVYKSPT